MGRTSRPGRREFRPRRRQYFRQRHVSYLRRDPLVPELLGIKRVASQSVLTRFFQGFTSAGDNLRCFRPLWHWCLYRLPCRQEGYTLDLDSTRLLHKDGQQEGVKGGYTKQGVKPCLHPLLAVLAEVRLVAQLWLRSGNASCGSNVTAFFLDLWDNLPGHILIEAQRLKWEDEGNPAAAILPPTPLTSGVLPTKARQLKR